MSDDDTDVWNIMFFVNPLSGNSASMTLLEPGVTKITLQCSIPVQLWFYDIRHTFTTSRHPGFIMLKSITEKLKRKSSEEYFNNESRPQPHKKLHQKVLAIAAGGDGTVMLLISQVFAHDIDSNFITFGVLPYGTGNDFARAFGWNHLASSCFFTTQPEKLHKVIEEWISASVVWHDIWDIVITTTSNGTFQKIDSTTGLKKHIDPESYMNESERLLKPPWIGEDRNGKNLCLKMCNYFSTGIESRIGLGFERHRTKDYTLNKLRYVMEGLKKLVCRKKISLNKQLSSLKEFPSNSSSTTIFSNAKDSPQQLRQASSLVVTNLPSFAAGLNIWDESKKWGLTTPVIPEYMEAKQKIGDGALEFTSFTGICAMGIERIFHGRGMRVHCGSGPFVLRFKSDLAINKSSKSKRVYFQVDGEFFVATFVSQAYIALWKKIAVITPNMNYKNNASSFYLLSDQ